MSHAETVDAAPAFQSVSTTTLVVACLAGDQDAWSALIDRYKRLICSIPIKQGMSADDAADIFQSVCLDLVAGSGAFASPKRFRSGSFKPPSANVSATGNARSVR